MYVKGSHHLNTSIITLSQSMYLHNNGNLRIISLNAVYQVIMKSIRGESQVRTFASQIAPTQSSHIVQSYKASTRQPYSYLVMDLVRLMIYTLLLYNK